jgi:hypothetical protein
MMDEATEIRQIYSSLKTNGERYKPLWDSISAVTGITVDPDYLWTNNKSKDTQLDEYVDDPTTPISVNQAGDYLLGIIWGTGDNVVEIVPSDDVKELIDEQLLAPWYAYASSRFLYQINHPDCGYMTALRPYAYDQFSFGNSGIGLFKNQAYATGVEQNCMIARQYGIDNTRVAEGKSGSCDIGSATYHWTAERIIGEFCCPNGDVDPKLLLEMPKGVQEAYAAKDFMKEFDIVFLWKPRKHWDPRLKGKNGARYEGFWFMDQEACKPFFRESFKERPINWTRMIKVRGEVYGRSSGTLLLSSIRYTNFAFAVTGEILEKMAQPALGVFGNSIFGDSVLDTSPDGLTVFNSTQMAGSQLPVFPIHEVGDPSGIIKFLLPYLNGKIVTAFKLDMLLDFSNTTEMTATEALQRYSIRGKALSGMLGMQKNERLIPDCRRGISICLDAGALGVDPKAEPQRAMKLRAINKIERIIPDEVLQVMQSGRPWYELRFNNELEKLARAEQLEALMHMLQAISAIAALYPPIVEAIKWKELLNAINSALKPQNQLLVTDNEFKGIINKVAAENRVAMQYQMAGAGAAARKDNASAAKNTAEAQEVANGSA